MANVQVSTDVAQVEPKAGGCDSGSCACSCATPASANAPPLHAPKPHRARFLREFFANPIATAAIAPSSRHLAAAMLRGVDLAAAKTIVEFGPGTGVFTRAVLEGLRAAGNTSALFLAIEKNARMAGELDRELNPAGPAGSAGPDSMIPSGTPAPAPSVRIIPADALDVDTILNTHARPHADFILSGLGWPSIPAAIRDAILEKTAAALPPGHEFRTFGYHIGLTLPGAWGFRKTVRRLFSRVTISPVVWRNLPPAFVYTCVK